MTPRTGGAPIQFEHVWKHYQTGGTHDSLRDMFSSWVGRWTGRNGHAHTEEFWALRDVSFEVRAGQTLGIIGHNGAGKSTILKLLSKISMQTKGRMAVRGRLAALIELGGGFHPDLSGAENVYLQGTMLGLTRKQIARSFDSIVAFSELDRFLSMPVKRYSSGMVVRLGFAIAAHVQPEILLLDEVLAVGDLAFQQKCFQRIMELKDAGTTMIFISHNLEAVQKLCDRVLVIGGGQVLGDGEPAEMIRRYRDEVFATTRLRRSAQAEGRRPEAAAVESIALRDEQGREMDQLAVGRPLRIDIALRLARPVQEPRLRVALERVDGLLCHVATCEPPELTGEAVEAVVSLHYPALPFLPNLYQIVVELFDGNSLVPIGSAGRGRLFEMTAERAAAGVVSVEHHWSVSVPSPVARVNG
jgi:lipopolysaccharide transport system ATP-binding protein